VKNTRGEQKNRKTEKTGKKITEKTEPKKKTDYIFEKTGRFGFV
jgi:hypothetical protein